MTSGKNKAPRRSEKQKPLWPLALTVFGVALLARLAYLIDFSASPISTYFILDPKFYQQTALGLLNGTLSIHAATFKAPLYPYFLAGIYEIFGPSPLAARLIQILMGSFSSVMIFYLTRRFYSRAVAVTAGLIAALYGPFILFDSELLIPSLIVFLDLASFLLLFRYEDSGKSWLLLASGLLLGLSALARPNVLIFLPGVVLWLWRFISRKRRQGWLGKSALYLAGVAIMLFVLAARNHAVTGEWSLFGNYGGYNFLIGNNRLADGRTAVLPGTSPEFDQGYRDAVKIATKMAQRPLDEQELNWFWFKLGLDYIFSNPLHWIGLEAKKLVFLTSGFEIPNNRHIYFFSERSPVLAPLLWDKVISFPFGILLPLALIALLAGQVRRDQFLLTFFLLAYSVSILLFFVNGRYRLPIVPVLIIWAAAGVWQMIKLWKRGNFKKFYKLLAVFLVAVVLCNVLTFVPGLKVRPETDYESHLYLGSALYQEGRYDEARVELLTAAKLYPKSPRVFNALGNTFVALGQDSLAAEYYKRGVEADPNYDVVAKSLSSLYKRDRRYMELNDFLLQRMDRTPKEQWAIEDYAWLHTQIDAKNQAIDIYERAWEADTSNYEPLFRRAQLLLELDFRSDAEQAYKNLLKRFPNSIEAHANLGQVYARQGRIEDALREFVWVREHDPENPGSYFNLASAYLQAGRLDLATQNLNRVAQIRPDFQGINLLRQAIQHARDSLSAGN